MVGWRHCCCLLGSCRFKVRVDERAKFFPSLAFIAARTSEYLLFTWRCAAARYRWLERPAQGVLTVVRCTVGR